MRQDFTGVTADELAKLFPVVLVPYNPRYPDLYLEESERLKAVFGGAMRRISHIGSTAVPGLLSKPTIDILLEVDEGAELDALTETLLDLGYVVNRPITDIICFIKGYTRRGFEGQAMHIHVRNLGDWGELYFRDYLIDHPETMREYADLKRGLKPLFEHDRDGYTDAKGEFVRRYTDMAKALYVDRYRPC